MREVPQLFCKTQMILEGCDSLLSCVGMRRISSAPVTRMWKLLHVRIRLACNTDVDSASKDIFQVARTHAAPTAVYNFCDD